MSANVRLCKSKCASSSSR